MPKITFSAAAAVFTGSPHDRNEVRDPEVFKQLHGIHSGDQFCSAYLTDDLVSALGLTGGRLRFEYEPESGQFRITTSYGIDRKPGPEELSELYRGTSAQWSDGIGGSEFGCYRGEAMSTTLGMALVNQDPDVDFLSEYFVDAYPPGGDRQLKTRWSDQGGPDDLMVNDLREGVRQGDPEAATILGSMMMDGDGVEQDQETAVALLTRAAKENEDVAIIRLAAALLEGTGVEPQPDLAIRLLERGIEDGSPLAISKLGDVYKYGRGVPAEPEKAIPLLEQAAEIGFLPALADLGDCYEHGIGVEVDRQQAHEMYQKCMAGGFEDVAPAIARLEMEFESVAASKNGKSKFVNKTGKKKSGGGIFGFFKRKKK